jgi:ubiquinone/menaquinone biosynthesis C-methylase UbiE
MIEKNIPAWAADVLTADGIARASIVDGVVRVVVPGEDPSIRFYRAVGGAHFYERSQVGYAMTTLDTSVYHRYLSELRPDDTDAVIVDVGGGDGRNTMPWLEWGYRRVVVADPAGAGLARLRARIAERNPEWLDRVLLLEADARSLPLKSASASRVFSIEALAYLNEQYGAGLAECARLLGEGGRLLVADRDYEGALLARLFYVGGVAGLLEQAGSRDVIDGNAQQTVRSRCFTAHELAREVEAAGLRIIASYGVSALSLVLGYLRNTEKLVDGDERRLPEVGALLETLGRSGAMRRSHVIIAERPRA